MSVDYRLIIKKLQQMETLFIAFSKATRMPYVECDEETFDDQVYLFAEEEDAKNWVKECEEKQIPLNIIKTEKEQMLMFYTSLYLIGVNRLGFHNGQGFIYLPLEQIVTIKRPEEGTDTIPQSNATLQLTMIYFLQELRRTEQSPKDPERTRRLQEMEQEMMANLIRSKYIMAIDISKVEEKFDPQKPDQNIQMLCMKNDKGEMMQPLFSDLWEFQKFSQNSPFKLRIVIVPFKGLLQSLIKESKGYVLNPAGVSLMLLRDKLEALSRQNE